MESRRTIQALVIGLALSLSVVLIKVGFVDDDPAAAPANRVAQPATARDQHFASATSASRAAPAAPALFAMGSPNARALDSIDFPIQFSEPADATGDSGHAPSFGGNGSAFAGSGSPAADGASGASRGASSTGAFSSGSGASGAGGGTSVGARSASNTTPTVAAAGTSNPAAPLVASASTSDSAPNDEGHRRGVRSLDGPGNSTSVGASAKAVTPASSVSPTPSPPLGDASPTILAFADASDVGPVQSVSGDLPFVFDPSSDAPVKSGNADGPSTSSPPFSLSTETPPRELATLDAPSAAIPEPGVMALLFLGLLALNLSRSAAVKRAGPLRRFFSKAPRAAATSSTSS